MDWLNHERLRDERKQSEAAARQAECQSREQAALLELAPVLVRDLNSRIVLWTQGAQRLYGFSKEEALGRVSHELLQTEFSTSLDQIDEALCRTGRWEGELVHCTRSGGRRVVTSLWVLHRDAEGRPARILEVDADLSAQKWAEQALRESQARLVGILDSAMDAIISIDEAQRVVFFNAAAERVFGCAAAEALGGPLDRFIPARYRAAHAAQVRAFGQTGVTSRTMGKLGELSGLRADGREFPIEASISQTEAGGDKLFTVILRDATERVAAELALRQSEERLRALNAELTNANQELEAFTNSVSHDLRAPLRHLMGFAKLLQDKEAAGLSARAQRYLTVISEEASRMGQLIDELLAFSRAGRTALRREPVDLGALVKEVIEELAHETQGRRIRWEIGPLPVVHADPPLLRGVLTNLLDNALKFTRERPEAHVEIGCRQAEGDDTIFFIRDNGAGFDMEYADKLFGVFQRLHSPEAFEGNGVGLANVRRIIQRHGGRTWAEGAVNAGATFYFSLPNAVPNAVESRTP